MDNPQTKRQDYIDWQEYFMATAFLAAKRSKDPRTQVGACIVNKDNKIVGTGYNGMPTGCSYDEMMLERDDKVCHAVMNAILNTNSADIKGCTIYVGPFPCNECVKMIIQSGIKEVVYMPDKDADKDVDKDANKDIYIASKIMLNAAGVKYWQFKPKNTRIVIDFEGVESPQTNRQDYIDWQEYFMATAFLAAKRSKDPKTQVGACIVNKYNKIFGIGYNGMPTGCSDDELPWGKNTRSALDSKYLYVCHAEMNAILNTNSADIKGCTIYVSLFPCNECAKKIIQSGIEEVVYMSDKDAGKDTNIASIKMLDAAGVKYWQFQPIYTRIVIDFEGVE